MHAMIENCIGCGCPSPIPQYSDKSGPYCEYCMMYGSPPPNPWWFPTAFSCWGPEERNAILRVMASDRYTMGPEVATFEREFAAFHGRKYAIMVNSGSSANLIIVSALFELGRISVGDAFVPALAWSTTYAPLVQHEFNLVLMDCDDSWNSVLLEYDRIVPKYNRPDIIVGCSILGNPAGLALLSQKARELGCPFIEDNCESIGARIGGKLCGTFGLMSSFSLFHSHQISAIEGGIILTDDDECNEMCRMLRAHGWSRDIKKPSSFSEEYDFRVMGYNVRPVEIHAAVAREQLKKLPRFVKERTNNFLRFRWLVQEQLCGLIRLPDINPQSTLSPFGLHFEVINPEARPRLVEALRAAKIDCRLPTGGSFTKHAYGRFWASQSTPRADLIHDRGLFLGNAPYDISDKIEKAIQIMKEVL